MWRTAKYLFLLVCGLFLAFILFDRLFPVDISPLKQTSRVVEDAKGAWLYTATNSDDKWRFTPDLQKIAPLYLQTLLSYEDKRFYTHWGIDIFAIVRAISQLIAHGSIVSGASTITMQLAKMLHPSPRTLFAKVTEMMRALQLEWHYSKDEILAGYLTLTPYGGNIEGLSAGSRHYFGKPPAVLSLEEIALLVSLPQSPESNRPELHPKRSKQARDKILGIMHDRGIIDSLSFKQAVDKLLPKGVHLFPRYAGHLAERLLCKIPKNMLNIKSTLDKSLQQKLEKWAKENAHKLPQNSTLAVLILRNSDTSVAAYLGSHDRFNEKTKGYVDMVQAIRSPGSLLKPFIYGLGFKQYVIHPDTIIRDEQTRFGGYMPHNFSRDYTGEVTIAYALQNSLNIPAVKVLQKVGAESFVEEMSHVIGTIKIPKTQVSLPIALGGFGISMWQITELYSVLAQGGKGNEIHSLQSKKQNTKQFLDSKSAQKVNAILRQTPPPFGFLNTQQQIAYKTGTSYGYRDVWTMAYDSAYTIGVWIGKPDNSPQLTMTGRQVAAPLAFELFSVLYASTPPAQWAFPAELQNEKLPEGLAYFEPKKEANESHFGFIYPKKNARYRSAECTQTIVEIKLKEGTAPYYLYLDDEPREMNTQTLSLPMGHGAHTLTVLDSSGTTISTEIWVDKPEC